MSGKIFVDTNVFVYLFDAEARAKQQRARDLLSAEAPRLVVTNPFP